ncbi:MAG: hypothetical protein ABR556_07225 [Pyrinomonadaceae bacterium]
MKDEKVKGSAHIARLSSFILPPSSLAYEAASDLDRKNQRRSFEGARKRLLETTFTLREM